MTIERTRSPIASHEPPRAARFWTHREMIVMNFRDRRDADVAMFARV